MHLIHDPLTDRLPPGCGWAVITAGYTDPVGALGIHREQATLWPSWSGVFFHPFVKAETVVLRGGPDGREPDDLPGFEGRRPAKWPVCVAWFGTDGRAAKRRALEVHAAPAVAVAGDAPRREDTGVTYDPVTELGGILDRDHPPVPGLAELAADPCLMVSVCETCTLGIRRPGPARAWRHTGQRT